MRTILIITMQVMLIIGMVANVFAVSAKEIINRSENAVRGNTQVVIMKITIKNRRWTRSMTMKSYEIRKSKKSFAEIIAPKKVSGYRFLLIKHDMKQYTPKLQRVIKISPSMMLQPWMGSDFTNDDIVKESSIVDDYNQKLLRKVTVNGHSCYKVELKPKPKAAVAWGKIVYYARTKDFLPVKKEYYNQRGTLKKIMSFSKYRKMGGRVIPTVYKMRTVRKKYRYTELEIKRIRFNVRIPGFIFTLQHLTRR